MHGRYFSYFFLHCIAPTLSHANPSANRSLASSRVKGARMAAALLTRYMESEGSFWSTFKRLPSPSSCIGAHTGRCLPDDVVNSARRRSVRLSLDTEHYDCFHTGKLLSNRFQSQTFILSIIIVDFTVIIIFSTISIHPLSSSNVHVNGGKRLFSPNHKLTIDYER